MPRESLIKEFIEDSTDSELSLSTLHYHEVMDVESDDNVVILSESILDKYYDDLQEYVETITLSIEEQIKYFYNPQKFCYDRYGSTDYWYLILELNQMYSMAQFNISTIKVFSTSVTRVLQTILNLESDNIDINTAEINKEIK